MPGSLVSNHVHIIFSTHERVDTIHDEYREHLYNLIAGVAEGYHCNMRAVGGTNNHIHMLMSLHQDSRLSYVIRDCKIATSKWIHEHGGQFQWQTGYGAFSVGQRELGVVTNYILTQQVHHQKHTFEEEMIKILKYAQISYNPDYVFG